MPEPELVAYCWGLPCILCKRNPASAFCLCQFTSSESIKPLCAACLFYAAWAKWNGYFSPKLRHMEIVATITLPGAVV